MNKETTTQLADTPKCLTITPLAFVVEEEGARTDLQRWDGLADALAGVTGAGDSRPGLAVVYDDQFVRSLEGRGDQAHHSVILHPFEDSPLSAITSAIAALETVRDALVQLGHVDFTP